MSLTHTRASIAFDLEGNEYAVDAPITRAMPRLTQALDLTRPTGEGTGGENIYVAAGISGRVFGYGHNGNKLYVNEGSGWTELGLVVSALDNFFCTNDGTLLYLGGTGHKLHRVTESGGVWSDAVAQESGSDIATAAGTGWEGQGIYQAPNGTLIWGEYGIGVTGLKMRRSTDDGATWTTVHTFVEANAGQNAHCHCVFFHPDHNGGAGRWYAWWGDGSNRQMLYSDDDGETWLAFTEQDEHEFQPLRAYAHGDLIIHGSDSSLGVYSADYTAGPGENPTFRELIPGWVRKLGVPNRFCWQLDKIGSVWIASHYDVEASPTRGCISVASDPTGEWTTIYRFQAGSFGLKRLCGPVGGYLYGYEDRADFSVHQIKLKVPTLANATATEVHPSCTNAISLGSSTNGTGWSNFTGGGTMTAGYTGDANHGSSSVRMAYDGTPSLVLPETIGVVAGQRLYATIRTKGGDKLRRGYVYLRYGNGAAQGFTYVAQANGGWTELQIGPHTVPEGEIVVQLWLVQSGTPPLDCLYDCAQITIGDTGPRTWQIGGTARAADKLTETLTSWPHRLSVWPLCHSDQLAADHYLCSWSAGDSSVSLYVGSDQKYKLAITKNGVAESVVESAATWFGPNAELKLTASLDESGTTITIADGGVALTLEGAAVPELLGADVAFTTGDTDGENVLPMAFASGVRPTYLLQTDSGVVLLQT